MELELASYELGMKLSQVTKGYGSHALCKMKHYQFRFTPPLAEIKSTLSDLHIYQELSKKVYLMFYN